MMSKRFVLLLLFCVHLVTSAAILAKSKTADEKEQIVKTMNEYRAALAQGSNTGNMNELSYDDELEKVGNSMTGDCNFSNGDYVLVPSINNIRDYLLNMAKVDKNALDEADKKIIGALTHPLQTKFACVDLVAPCPNRQITGSGFCLIGPQSSQPTKDEFKQGPLGSHCDHGVADNGLCKVPLKSATTGMNSLIFAVFAVFVMIFY